MAEASRGPHRLRELSITAEQVSFIQPDGSGTILELATGRVLGRRAPAQTSAPARLPPCEIIERQAVCPFPEGVLSVEMLPFGFGIELRTNDSVWQAVRRDGFAMQPSPMGFWLAHDSVLIESPGGLLGTLECLDVGTGSPRWLYVYPSEPSDSSSYRMEDAATARSMLDIFSNAAQEGIPVGTIPIPPQANLEAVAREPAQAVTVALNDRYPAPIVLDPDPQREGSMKTRVAVSWMLLALILGAILFVTFRPPAAPVRDRASVILTFLLGILLGAVRDVDWMLEVTTGLSFCVVWLLTGARVAKDHPRPRLAFWLLVPATAVLFVVLIVLVGSMLTVGRVFSYFDPFVLGTLGVTTGITFGVVWLLTGARMAKDGRGPRLALWLVLLATAALFLVPRVLPLMIRE